MDTFQRSNTLSPFEHFLLASPRKTVDAFFTRWPVDLIFRLRVLNTTIYCALEAYRVRTWNPVCVLMPFFSDVHSFLSTLDKCNGVVSSSQAVRLLQRHPFPDTGSDLDIFLPRHGLMRMGQWLKWHGYSYQPMGLKHTFFDVEAIRSASVAIGLNSDGTEAYPRGRTASQFATYHFTRRVTTSTPTGHRLEDLMVQLVVVEPAPVQYIISNFHSTGVMNWFTGKMAVSLFPRSTFVDRISYVTRDVSRTEDDWIVKYRQRGFELVMAGGVPTGDSDEVQEWERHVGDVHTWIMPFDISGCQFLLPYGITQRDIWKYNQPPIKFEVIPHGYGVAPVGAYLRVSVPFVYSALAFVTGGVDLPGTFYTHETGRVFG